MKKCTKCGICGADVGMELGMDCRFASESDNSPETYPMEFTNEVLEVRWNELGNIVYGLMQEGDGDKLAADWFLFPVGTQISEIHEWFDNEYS